MVGGAAGTALGWGADPAGTYGDGVDRWGRETGAAIASGLSSKRGIKQIEDIAKEFDMDRTVRREFGDFIEVEKAAGRGGTANRRGDFTYRELQNKARGFLDP